MYKYLIEGGHPLRGRLRPSGNKNAALPCLAATLLTGVFVVEIIFNYPGVSFIALRSMNNIPDAPAALGFAIFSVFLVLLLMAVLDLIQYGMDPRIREKA